MAQVSHYGLLNTYKYGVAIIYSEWSSSNSFQGLGAWACPPRHIAGLG